MKVSNQNCMTARCTNPPVDFISYRCAQCEEKASAYQRQVWEQLREGFNQYWDSLEEKNK